METKILNFTKGIAKCEGEGYVNNQIACSASFVLIQPDELNKYMPKKK